MTDLSLLERDRDHLAALLGERTRERDALLVENAALIKRLDGLALASVRPHIGQTAAAPYSGRWQATSMVVVARAGCHAPSFLDGEA